MEAKIQSIKNIDTDGELAYIGMCHLVAQHINSYLENSFVTDIVDDFFIHENSHTFENFRKYLSKIKVWNGKEFKKQFKEIWNICTDIQDMTDIIAIVYNIDCYISYESYNEDNSKIICYNYNPNHEYNKINPIGMYKECSRLETLIEFEILTMKNVLQSVESINACTNNMLDGYDCSDDDEYNYAFNILERIQSLFGGIDI